MECWLETVTKTAKSGKLRFAVEMARHSSKNTVVKNEVCISDVLTDLETLTRGAMQNKFCGLSLIHADPPANSLLKMMYRKDGQHVMG